MKNIKSYVSGIIYYSWNQTQAKYEIIKTKSTKDTAEFTIHGYYLLGISIGSLKIGASYNDVWKCSLRLYKK